MFTFLLWVLLLVFCWPLALLALVLYPIVWLLLLPFRIVGIAVEGVFELLRAIIFLPARVLGGGPRRPLARAICVRDINAQARREVRDPPAQMKGARRRCSLRRALARG